MRPPSVRRANSRYAATTPHFSGVPLVMRSSRMVSTVKMTPERPQEGVRLEIVKFDLVVKIVTSPYAAEFHNFKPDPK